MAKRPTLLYRREISGKTLELTEHSGVYQLQLSWLEEQKFEFAPTSRMLPAKVAIALVDPTYSNPIQQARRV